MYRVQGSTTAHLLRQLEGERDDGRLEIEQLRSEYVRVYESD